MYSINIVVGGDSELLESCFNDAQLPLLDSCGSCYLQFVTFAVDSGVSVTIRLVRQPTHFSPISRFDTHYLWTCFTTLYTFKKSLCDVSIPAFNTSNIHSCNHYRINDIVCTQTGFVMYWFSHWLKSLHGYAIKVKFYVGHPCRHFLSGLVKSPLNIGHGWVFTPHFYEDAITYPCLIHNNHDALHTTVDASILRMHTVMLSPLITCTLPEVLLAARARNIVHKDPACTLAEPSINGLAAWEP